MGRSHEMLKGTYCIVPKKRACLNKRASPTFDFGWLYLSNYSTDLNHVLRASSLGIPGFTWQVSLKSNKDKGSFSA